MAVDVATQLLTALRNHRSDDSIIAFVTAFATWKTLSFAEQLGSDLFGADRQYVAPTVNGQVRLRHTHLQPESPAAKRSWAASGIRGQEKTSDRALIYCDNDGDLLLIYLLRDGTAHSVSRMQNNQDRETMQGAATLTAAWIADRTSLNGWVNLLP